MTELLAIIKEYFNDKTIIKNLDKFKILLENDIIDINKTTINVEFTDKNNNKLPAITIFHYFCDSFGKTSIVGKTTSDEIINLWMDKKIDLNKDYGNYGSTLSFIYKICSDKEKITQLIVKSGFSFKDFKLPLLYMHNGSFQHNFDIAKAVIKCGYDINNIPVDMNPLYALCCSKVYKNIHLTMFEYLLYFNIKFDKQYNLLKEAINNDHDIFVKLLLEAGAELSFEYKTENKEINNIIKNFKEKNNLTCDYKEIKLSVLKNIIDCALLIDKSCFKSNHQYNKLKEYQNFIENFNEQKHVLNYDVLGDIRLVFGCSIKEKKYVEHTVQYFEILEKVLTVEHYPILLINDKYDYSDEIQIYDLEKRIKKVEEEKYENDHIYKINVIHNHTNFKDKKCNDMKYIKIDASGHTTLNDILNILNGDDFCIKENNFKILVNNKNLIICDTFGYHIDKMTYGNPDVSILRNIFGSKKINTFEIFNL